MRCDNCHREFEPHSYGTRENYFGHNFCSWACKEEWEQKIHNQTVMKGLLVRQRIQEQEQAELQRQQARQEMAIAQAQAAAEKDELAKKYGFTSASNAEHFIQEAKWRFLCSESDDYETKLQKAKEHREYKKQYDAERRKEKKERHEFIFSLMNEEQKKKNSSIARFSEKAIDKDHSVKSILLAILFPILWIIAYKLFLERFLYRFGFWSSLITFIGLGGIIIYFLGISSIKMKINKIAKIKGDDNFPFYPVSSAGFGTIPDDLAVRNDLCKNGGISILIAVAIFKFFGYVHVPYLGTILKVLSVVGCMLPIVFFISSSGDGHKVTKNNIQFKSLTDYYQYRIIQYARKKLGQFILDGDDFSKWKNGKIRKNHNEFWLYTFLPEKENREFTEKYGKFSSSGINCIEQILKKDSKSKAVANSEKFNVVLDIVNADFEKIDEKEKLYGVNEYHFFDKEYFYSAENAPYVITEFLVGSDEKNTHGYLYKIRANLYIKEYAFLDEKYEKKLSKLECAARNEMIKAITKIKDKSCIPFRCRAIYEEMRDKMVFGHF